MARRTVGTGTQSGVIREFRDRYECRRPESQSRCEQSPVELADRPIILAGGLTPENVKRAILTVRPAGVEVP